MKTWTNDQLRAARTVLAKLYKTEKVARRVVSDIKVDEDRIDFDGDANTMWFNILQELNKLQKVDEVVRLAAREFESNDDVRGLQQWLTIAQTTPKTDGTFETSAPSAVGPALQSSPAALSGPPAPLSSTTWKVSTASAFTELSGELWRQLRDALTSAFTSYEDLQTFVQFYFNENLANFAAPGGLQGVVYKLIQKSQSEGWTEKLFRAARTEKPGNPRLLALELVVTAPGSPTPPRPLDESALEQVLRRDVPTLKLDGLLHTLGEIGCRVCRVEINGLPRGTGFLIGPSCVITNYHVMQQVVAGVVTADKVKVRFDYRTDYNGVTYGLDLAPGAWLVHSSPYAPFEAKNLQGGTPTLDELDYTVVRVDGVPGKKAIGANASPDAPRRGWVKLPAGDPPALPKDMPLFVVQHPQGRTMEIAIETHGVIEVNANRTRLRHGVNTDPGSSGSPVFDLTGNLVALHHAGDPATLPVYNQAVPIDTIRASLERAGKFDEIGN